MFANQQLAELIKARGPNMHVNAACGSMAAASTIAEDWIRRGLNSNFKIQKHDFKLRFEVNITYDNFVHFLYFSFTIFIFKFIFCIPILFLIQAVVIE